MKSACTPPLENLGGLSCLHTVRSLLTVGMIRRRWLCVAGGLLFALFLALHAGGTNTLAAEAPGAAAPAVAPPVIRSASEYDYPPYCIVTPDQQADGFSVELLRAALKTMGREVVFELGPWSEVKQKLADGKVQVLPLVGRTPEREHLFNFTFPYLTMHGTIVVRNTESGIHGVADLKGREVAVMRGDNAEEFLRRSGSGVTITTTATFDDALRELADGKHDAVVIQKLTALQLMNKNNLANLKIVGPPLKEFVQSFCFAVRKGDHKLLDLLNEGLSIVISDGTFRQLREKWFGPIELTEGRKSRIVVGGDADYPPYEFLDENGQPAGYNVDLTRAIARQAGIEVDIQLRPWGKIREGLAEHRIDAVQGMFYSPERDTAFDFSPAHTLISHVIAVREGTQLPESLAELAGMSILVMAGDIMHDMAVKQGYARQLVVVGSQEEALRRLASGQGDCALVAKLPALYWANKHNWKNLRFSVIPIVTPDYCYAVPHGNDVLLSRLANGLAAVKATGEYRQIYSRWLGVYEKPELSGWEIFKYTLYGVVPVIALLLGSVLWSQSLKVKVTNATAQLQQEIEERKEALAALDAKNAEMERFLYTVSHDLRSPVVTIKGFLGLLDSDLQAGNEAAVANDKKYIHLATDRIRTLLDDLLEFSRIGRVVNPQAECTFHELASEALAMVGGAVTSRKVEVTIEQADIRFYGDRSRLLEIWQNLLENAVKYMGEQSAPRIEVGVEQRDRELVFFVRDNGIGINPQYAEKIFGLFEKLDAESEGSGLGLALVARIVKLNQGRIWVESAGIGAGSCFCFTLPGAVISIQG